ncbi:cyclin-dependent kinase 10 [Globomyces pollinis-pini]|nr:cyclin-dependent kinase 10 [Globomyces pollinis-pini]
MDYDNEGFPISSLREISILKTLRHENIVRVYEVVVANGLENIFMVMEYCEQDMAYLMDNVMSRNPSNAYKPMEVKCLLNQLLDGVDFLHRKSIIHRDLKLSNLLLTSKGILKIADFGLARKFDNSTEFMTPKVVTLWYRAPEVLLGSTTYCESIDMWSVGCIFGEFLKSEPLLPGSNEPQQLMNICKLLGTPVPSIWPDMVNLPLYKSIKLPYFENDSIKSVFRNETSMTHDLLRSFLDYNPKRRITSSEALNHPYFTENPKMCSPVMLPTYPEFRNDKVDSSVSQNYSQAPAENHKEQSSRLKRLRPSDSKYDDMLNHGYRFDMK